MKKEENKQIKNFWYMIAIIVLAFALLFYAGGFYKPALNTDQHYEYNGFTFDQIDGLWYTEVLNSDTNRQFVVPLHFGPRDLEYLSVDGEGLNNSFYRDQIYITFDPEEERLDYIALAAAEISLNLKQAIGYGPIAACTQNISEGCASRPIVDCSTEGVSVIHLKRSDTPSIVLEDECITIAGKEESLIKATDRLILQWYNIMR